VTTKCAAHAAYLQGEGKYADRDDVRAVIDGNLPVWATDANAFFRAADANERKNGRAYLEIEAAIPREAPDPVAWARQFAAEALGDRFPYRLAVHDREASDGGRNVHLHLMFSDRPTDGEHFDAERFFKRNGSKKDRTWNKRDQVNAVRSLFAAHVRHAAPEWWPDKPATPEPKIGPALPRAGERYNAMRAERVAEVIDIRAARRAREEREAINETLSEAEEAMRNGWEADVSTLETRLDSLMRQPLTSEQRTQLDAVRRKVEEERRRREAEAQARQQQAQRAEAAQRQARQLSGLAKLVLYARYAELRPETPAGQAYRQQWREKQRTWPKAAQALEGKGFAERILLEFAAEDLLRDGLITETELASAGIDVEKRFIDKKGDGRADDALKEIWTRIATESEHAYAEISAVSKAVAEATVAAIPAPGEAYDSSIVQSAIVSAKSAVRAAVTPAPSGTGAAQAAPAAKSAAGVAPTPKPPAPKQ
jgi:MobA/MobL family